MGATHKITVNKDNSMGQLRSEFLYARRDKMPRLGNIPKCMNNTLSYTISNLVCGFAAG